MVRVFYSPVYVGSAHVFETTRKAQWIADSLGSVPIGGIELVSPSSLSYDQLVQVHDPGVRPRSRDRSAAEPRRVTGLPLGRGALADGVRVERRRRRRSAGRAPD